MTGHATEEGAAQPQLLSQTDQLLMMSLSRFYHDPANMHAVLPYMNNTSVVSLRMIDWFVTNYSKKCNVIIPLTAASSDTVIQYFNVYVNYRVQLKAYSKQQFDPFRRRDRILLQYDDGARQVQTTVGQLNFFRWLILNGILTYIVTHASMIESDMMHSDRSSYQRSARRNRPSVALSLEVGVRPDTVPVSASVPVPVPGPGPVPIYQRRRTELSKATLPTMNRHSGMCTVMFT